MSYDGHLGFGLLGDYDALPDLEELALDLKWARRGPLPGRRRAAAGAGNARKSHAPSARPPDSGRRNAERPNRGPARPAGTN